VSAASLPTFSSLSLSVCEMFCLSNVRRVLCCMQPLWMALRPRV
jgi:hypothetical protein